MRLNAENDCSEVAFVASTINNSRPENAVLSVADSLDKTPTASYTEKLSANSSQTPDSLQRGFKGGSCALSSSLERSFL